MKNFLPDVDFSYLKRTRQKAPSKMFDRVLIKPLYSLAQLHAKIAKHLETNIELF